MYFQECAMNRPSNNDSLSERIVAALSSTSHLARSMKRDAGFIIRHYAQSVAYVVDGLVEKNKVCIHV